MDEETLDNFCREHLEKKGAIVIQEKVEEAKVIPMNNEPASIPAKRKVLGS